MDQTMHQIYYVRSQNLSFPSLLPIIPTSVDIHHTPLVACVSIHVYDSLVYYIAGSKLAQCNHDGMELLGPFITANLDEKRESENFVRHLLFILLENCHIYQLIGSEQNDYLTWLIQKSKAED